jgi:heme exporter protein B
VSALLALFRRELALAWGRGGGPLNALAFYVGTATLLPLAVGAEPQRLAAVSTGAAFAALALASLLSLERMFERDFEDGALDLLTLGGPPLEAVAAIKALAQWTANGLPLALVSPVVASALGAPLSLAPLMVLTALLAGLAMTFLGGAGAALALGAKRGGVLVAVIVLPLYAPPVILAAGSVEAFAQGLPWSPPLLFLAAYALAAAALTPFAMAAACRNAVG